MGVWANGPSPTTVDLPGIAAAMRPALEMWMSARLKIYDPKRSTTIPYDPVTDTGGIATPVLILDTGANGAIVQPLGAASRAEIGGQPNGVMTIRFQVKILPEPTVPLRGGLLVQVVDGGNAQIPDTWRFSIIEDADSSLMWDRIMHATLITGGV